MSNEEFCKIPKSVACIDHISSWIMNNSRTWIENQDIIERTARYKANIKRTLVYGGMKQAITEILKKGKDSYPSGNFGERVEVKVNVESMINEFRQVHPNMKIPSNVKDYVIESLANALAKIYYDRSG
jgi:hypothetical protein